MKTQPIALFALLLAACGGGSSPRAGTSGQTCAAGRPCAGSIDCCTGYVCTDSVCVLEAETSETAASSGASTTGRPGSIGGTSGVGSSTAGPSTTGAVSPASSAGASSAGSSTEGTSGGVSATGASTSSGTSIAGGTAGGAAISGGSTTSAGATSTTTAGASSSGGQATSGTTAGATGGTTGAGAGTTGGPPPGGCVSDANCSGGEHCDTRAGSLTQGQCLACLTSAQCQGGQVCDPAQGDCVFDCRAAGSPSCADQSQFSEFDTTICDPVTGACVACKQDSDCAGSPDGPTCNTVNDSCVGCVSWSDCGYGVGAGCYQATCGQCGGDSDCPPGQTCTQVVGGPGYCACYGASGCGGDQPVCVAPGGSAITDTSGFFPLQEPAWSGCGCTGNGDCSNGEICVDSYCFPSCVGQTNFCQQGQLCNGADGLCVDCLSDADCAGSIFPLCNANNDCVECQTDADCAGDAGSDYPYCDQTSSSCEQCRTGADCAATPDETACDSQGYCDCAMPSGELDSSCATCSVNFCTLTCVCPTGSGAEINSSLQLPCASGVTLCDGVLACGGCGDGG